MPLSSEFQPFPVTRSHSEKVQLAPCEFCPERTAQRVVAMATSPVTEYFTPRGMNTWLCLVLTEQCQSTCLLQEYNQIVCFLLANPYSCLGYTSPSGNGNVFGDVFPRGDTVSLGLTTALGV